MSSGPGGGDINLNAHQCRAPRRQPNPPDHCCKPEPTPYCCLILPCILGALGLIFLFFILWLLWGLFFPPTLFNFACRPGVTAFACKGKRCQPSCESTFLGFMESKCKTWDNPNSILKARDDHCFDDHFCIGGNGPEIYIQMINWIHVDHITINHRNKVGYIPIDVPKDFVVYGCKDNCGDMSIHIGTFKYDIDGAPVQKFVSNDKKSTVRALSIKIITTWGHKGSRIHRIGVYGTEADSTGLKVLNEIECIKAVTKGFKGCGNFIEN